MNFAPPVADKAKSGIWGLVRRAMSIIKQRTGAHEATIREYRIGNRALSIGEPLDGFQGVLRGIPAYVGMGKPLLGKPVR